MSDNSPTLAAITAQIVNTGNDSASFQLRLNEGKYICDVDVQLLRVENTEERTAVFFQPITRHCNTGAYPATTH